MFSGSIIGLTQDQALALSSQVTAYVREALVHDKGYFVFAFKDTEDFPDIMENFEKFDFIWYLTDGEKLEFDYGESRNEAIDRILFVVDCEKFHKYADDTESVKFILPHLMTAVIGRVSALYLLHKKDIKDMRFVFKGEEILR